MRRVYVETNGCAVLRHETQRYAKFFRANGFTETESPEDAEIVLMTTCGVVNWTEDKAIEALERIVTKSRKDAKILVGGCLPKINPDRVSGVSSRIVMFGPKEPYLLNDIILANTGIEEISYTDGATRDHSFGDPEIAYSSEEIEQLRIVQGFDCRFNTSQFTENYNYLTKGRHFWKERDLLEIKASSGCTKNCTFCATKFAIGGIQSEDPDKIVKECREGIDRGFRKIVLLGDEVGNYGVDIGTNITRLIDSLDELDGNHRIALRYVDPDALVSSFEGLKRHFESGRIYYLCSAFQSGSKKILSLMHRNPNISKFVDTMIEIDQEYPQVFKHTQVIIGFPQETEEEFGETLNILSRANFDYVTSTAYKDRKGTRSSQFSGHIEESNINRRYLQSLEFIRENRNKQLWRRTQRELSKHLQHEYFR